MYVECGMEKKTGGTNAFHHPPHVHIAGENDKMKIFLSFVGGLFLPMDGTFSTLCHMRQFPLLNPKFTANELSHVTNQTKEFECKQPNKQTNEPTMKRNEIIYFHFSVINCYIFAENHLFYLI